MFQTRVGALVQITVISAVITGILLLMLFAFSAPLWLIFLANWSALMAIVLKMENQVAIVLEPEYESFGEFGRVVIRVLISFLWAVLDQMMLVFV